MSHLNLIKILRRHDQAIQCLEINGERDEVRGDVGERQGQVVRQLNKRPTL